MLNNISTNQKENTLGFVVGILSIVNVATAFVFSWFLAPLYIVSSLVYIVLGSVSLKKSIDVGSTKSWAVTALATSIPTLIWSFVWTLLLVVVTTSN